VSHHNRSEKSFGIALADFTELFESKYCATQRNVQVSNIQIAYTRLRS